MRDAVNHNGREQCAELNARENLSFLRKQSVSHLNGKWHTVKAASVINQWIFTEHPLFKW